MSTCSAGSPEATRAYLPSDRTAGEASPDQLAVGRLPNYPPIEPAGPPVSVSDPMMLARLAVDAVRVLTRCPISELEDRSRLDDAVDEIMDACFEYMDVSLESLRHLYLD